MQYDQKLMVWRKVLDFLAERRFADVVTLSSLCRLSGKWLGYLAVCDVRAGEPVSGPQETAGDDSGVVCPETPARSDTHPPGRQAPGISSRGPRRSAVCSHSSVARVAVKLSRRTHRRQSWFRRNYVASLRFQSCRARTGHRDGPFGGCRTAGQKPLLSAP